MAVFFIVVRTTLKSFYNFHKIVENDFKEETVILNRLAFRLTQSISI